MTIYLDHAATTPVRPEVRQAMEPFLGVERFGNPSSIHAVGQAAKSALDDARDTIANAIGAEHSEITFTSGGTEADNLALVGIMLANKHRGNHLITTAIEHDAVLNSAKFLKSVGFDITILPVDEFGRVDPKDVQDAITERTILVSVMHANNEIGTIQPVEQIGEICRKARVYLHIDAVQTFGQLPLNVRAFNVDALTLSSHKIYGPMGIGALYVRSGTPIDPIVHGGGQERGRRCGTENVPGIVGFGAAVKCLIRERDATAKRMTVLRDNFLGRAFDAIPELKLNGHPTGRLPNNINISLPGIEGEAMLLNLDLAGVCASSGSACSSGSIEPSHVLTAMGLPMDRIRSSIRLTLGRTTSEEELDRALDILVRTTRRLQEMTGYSLAAA